MGRSWLISLRRLRKCLPGRVPPVHKSFWMRCYNWSTLQLSVSGVLQQIYWLVAQSSKMLQGEPKMHLLPRQIAKHRTILHSLRFPKLSPLLTSQSIFLCKSNRLWHCLFLVYLSGSKMLGEFPKARIFSATPIFNCRTILNICCIILSKSNGLFQC